MFTTATDWVVITCADCTLQFAMTAESNRRYRETHKRFYCPAGHSNYYPQKSDKEALEEKLRIQARKLDQAETRAAEAKRRAQDLAKSNQKIRKRIMNGVCPCCDKVFPNLLNHMQSKHADFESFKMVRTLRQMLGLTQSQLAKEIGNVSTATISHYENGLKVSRFSEAKLKQWVEQAAEKA